MAKTNGLAAPAAGEAVVRDRSGDSIRFRPGTRIARKLVGSAKNRSAFLEQLARLGDPERAADALGLPLLVLLRQRDADPGFAAEWAAAVHYAWELLESRMLGTLMTQSADAVDTRLALAIVNRRGKPALTAKSRPADSAAVARLRAELRSMAGQVAPRD